MTGILQKDEAAKLLSYLFILHMLLRTSSTFVEIKSFYYLKATCYYTSEFLCLLAFVLYAFGFRLFLVYSSAFFYPFTTFMFLPAMLTLPSNFNVRLSPNTASKMMMSYAIGEAVFTSVAGYLMKWIHPMALYGFLLTIAVFMGLSFYRLIKLLAIEKTEPLLEAVAAKKSKPNIKMIHPIH